MRSASDQRYLYLVQPENLNDGMMERRAFTVLAYLDDFLIIADTKVECQHAYEELIRLLGDLGFQINWDKALGPCQRLTFLGIEIDTVRRQLTLPNASSANCDCYLRNNGEAIYHKTRLAVSRWQAQFCRTHLAEGHSYGA